MYLAANTERKMKILSLCQLRKRIREKHQYTGNKYFRRKKKNNKILCPWRGDGQESSANERNPPFAFPCYTQLMFRVGSTKIYAIVNRTEIMQASVCVIVSIMQSRFIYVVGHTDFRGQEETLGAGICKRYEWVAKHPWNATHFKMSFFFFFLSKASLEAARIPISEGQTKRFLARVFSG